VFSRFTAEREKEFATFDLLAGAVILGAALGNASLSAIRGISTPFHYYMPALPLWYRAFFIVGSLALAVKVRNKALCAALLVFAVDHVFRMSLFDLPVGAVIFGALLMSAGFTLNTKDSWWTRRPALVVIAVVLASAALSLTVQSYALRILERRREALRPKAAAQTIAQPRAIVV
jgi:hypothetical protein